MGGHGGGGEGERDTSYTEGGRVGGHREEGRKEKGTLPTQREVGVGGHWQEGRKKEHFLHRGLGEDGKRDTSYTEGDP